MDERTNPTQYAVICFLPRRDGVKDEIDLVPFSWIDTIGEKRFCYYPNNKRDLKRRDKFLENLSPPKPTWPPCEIDVISITGKLQIIYC